MRIPFILRKKILVILISIFSVLSGFSKEKETSKINWISVTPYEYIGQDSKNSFLLDLYDDFIDAKIDNNKLQNIMNCPYSEIIDFLSSSGCLVGKLHIMPNNTDEIRLVILFMKDDVLFEGNL